MIRLIVMFLSVLNHRLILIWIRPDVVCLVVLIGEATGLEILKCVKVPTSKVTPSEQPWRTIITVARKVNPPGFIVSNERSDVTLGEMSAGVYRVRIKQNDNIQPRSVHAIHRVVVAVPIQVQRGSLPDWIPA